MSSFNRSRVRDIRRAGGVKKNHNTQTSWCVRDLIYQRDKIAAKETSI